MNYEINTVGAACVLTVSGNLGRHNAGALYDVIVLLAQEHRIRLAVDLSGVTAISHAGARGLIVGARLAMAHGGQMRICGAQPSVWRFLDGLGFGGLLKFDRTLAEALERLGSGLSHPANSNFSGSRQVLTSTEGALRATA